MSKRPDSYVENVLSLTLKDVFLASTIVLAAITIFNLPSSFYDYSLTGPRAATKRFRTFGDFYGFYLSEHLDPFNRKLHIIGTTLVIIITLLCPALLQSIGFAALAGYFTCSLFQGFSNGIAEGAIFLSTLLLVSKYNDCLKYAFLILVVGYAFAWVGHFNYELNKPATFIYPTYSLMGDFRMWFDCITGRQPGVWK